VNIIEVHSLPLICLYLLRCIYFLHFTQFLYQGNCTWNLTLHFWCIIKFLLKCCDFYTNMAKLNNVSSKFKLIDPQLHIPVTFCTFFTLHFNHILMFSVLTIEFHTLLQFLSLCFVTYLVSLPSTFLTCFYY